MKIEDSRLRFSTNTFTNNKKTTVLKELEKCIYYQQTDQALLWTADLLCSGFLIEIWNLYIHILCKYIHIHNPKITLYIHKKFTDFKKMLEDCEDDLQLRNKEEARTLFFSVTLLLSETNKDTILECMNFVFNFDEIFTNLKAPNMKYIQPFFKDGDPKEIFIPLNELAYHLFETKNKKDIFYWIEWIIEYDNKLTRNKKQIKCIKRDFIKTKILNIIWMIWEIMMSINPQTIMNKIIIALFELFSIKYTVNNNYKKKDLLMFSAMLIIHEEHIQFDKKIIDNVEIFNHLNDKINNTFEQLKKSEMISE
jgi:hypothetical protein